MKIITASERTTRKGPDDWFTGTVWIDKKTFARVRVQAVQGGLSAPVISNDETQHYSPIVVGNRPVFLFSGLTARQILLIAGRNLLVEKSVFGDAEMLDQRLTELARVAPRPDGYIDRLFLSS